MSDTLQNAIVLPADGQRTFEELREEFREQNRQRIRRSLRPHEVVRYHKDGAVAGRVRTGLMTDAPAGQDHRRMDDYIMQGGQPPECSDEFKVVEGAGLARELRDLSRDASALALHEGVKYPNAPEETSNAASTSNERSRGNDSEHQCSGADTNPAAEG